MDVTENVVSNSWLLCHQKKLKEIQAKEIKLKRNLSCEERDQSRSLALEDHSCDYDNAIFVVFFLVLISLCSRFRKERAGKNI